MTDLLDWQDACWRRRHGQHQAKTQEEMTDTEQGHSGSRVIDACGNLTPSDQCGFVFCTRKCSFYTVEELFLNMIYNRQTPNGSSDSKLSWKKRQYIFVECCGYYLYECVYVHTSDHFTWSVALLDFVTIQQRLSERLIFLQHISTRNLVLNVFSTIAFPILQGHVCITKDINT